MTRADTPPKMTWSERGSAAIDNGDLESAKQCFMQAMRAETRNAKHRFHLAVVQESLEEFGAAATTLTEALRLDPMMADAARRLALMAARCAPLDGAELDPKGLKAALGHDTVDRELVADVALQHLSARQPLKGALDSGRSAGWLATARGLCLRKTDRLLRDELFLEVLRTSIVRNPDLERLLAALRRVLLLELPPDRLEDRGLVSFAIALMQQCRANEYVWAVSPQEAGRLLEEEPLSVRDLLDGDFQAACRLLLLCLYEPVSKTLPTDVQDVGNIRPKALREALAVRLAEEADERGRARQMPSLGPVVDETSRKVGAQYEASPYPRWNSVGLLKPRDYRRLLGVFIAPERLTFMDQPFEVLIAGCGTGQQVVQAAKAYGPNAKLLAFDLSVASLAYAARMADRFKATNVRFAQADLQEIGTLLKFGSRFRVIECVGVLHHMADPFKGWRALIECLAPRGVMLVGLYSATARRNLASLRKDPDYPGPGCSDEALRVFRQTLIDRRDGEPGSELKISRDFYTASNFRDLVLHVSERSLMLPEIARFLDDNGLVFRGFQNGPRYFELLQERYPNEEWPGILDHWAELEDVHPHLFNGMYIFWCERAMS